MKKNNNNASVTEELAEPVQNLMDDARELLAATAHVAEDKVVEARRRLSNAVEKGKHAWHGVQRSAVAGARATDEAIREHPYQTAGVALGIGIVVGLLLGRRKE